MKCRYPYSFEQFETHRAAMPHVMQWQHLHLTSPPTEIGTSQTHSARSGRIIEYFNDCYSYRHEAADKSMVFMAIHEYIALHFRTFKWHRLLKRSRQKGDVLVTQGLFRAVHFAVTKLGTEGNISRRKVTKLAKAFNTIYQDA